jgi:2-dehydropantoate 2-reductase
MGGIDGQGELERVGIVGTGVIGTLYGWALSEAGVDVTHLVRPGRATGTAKLDLDILDERRGHPKRHRATYAAGVDRNDREARFDLVVVPTGRHDVEEAVSALAPRAGEAVFLILSSNWDGTSTLDRLLPAGGYVLGYPDGGGTILGDGVYWVNLGSEIHLGTVDERAAHALHRISALFQRADIRPGVEPEILHWLWVHNASTVAFQAAFARDLDIRAMLRDRRLMRTTVAATRELLDVCERRGVDVRAYPDVASMRWPTWAVVTFMRILFRTNKSMQRYTAHAGSLGSLREAPDNYDDMLRTARDLGVETRNLWSLGEALHARVRISPTVS